MDTILDYFCEGFFIMNELIELSAQLHLIFIVVLIGLIFINLYLLKSDKTFFNLSKRLELIAPQYYIVLSAIFFTGLIVMAVRQFSFSFVVWEMIIAWIVMVGLGIKNHKLYKKARLDAGSQNAYKALAFRKYLLDLALVVITIVLFYTVH